MTGFKTKTPVRQIGVHFEFNYVYANSVSGDFISIALMLAWDGRMGMAHGHCLSEGRYYSYGYRSPAI